MYKRVHCLVLASLIACVSAIDAAPSFAQTKPVVVVSVAGIDTLISDIGYLTEAAGVGDLGRTAMMMSGAYTAGLDRTRPIGVVVATTGPQVKPLGFVPVTNLDQFLSVLPPQVGKARDMGDGVRRLEGRAPIFIKEQGGWAFVGQDAESLNSLPQSPVEQLGGLNEDYDIAVRVHVANIPDAFKQMALMAMKAGVQAQMQRQPGEGDAQFELRQKLMQSQTQQWDTLINEIDQVTVGWNADRDGRKTYLEMSMSAVEGSETAKQIAAMSNVQSAFKGLLGGDAAVTLNVTAQIAEKDIQSALTMLETMRETAKREIEKDGNLPDQQALDTAKGVLDSLFDVAKGTIEAGKMDGAAAVKLAPQAMTVLVGAQVADGGELESALKKLVEVAKDDPEFPGINWDADEHAGVRFHTMRVDIPEGEDARQVFGDQLELAFGVGSKRVYLAIGKGGLSQLKDAMDQSGSGADASVPPFQMRVALGQILRFAASVDDNPVVSMMASAVEKSEGRDHIIVRGDVNGPALTYRFELEEGVLQAIGQAATMANAQRGAF